MSQYQYGDVNPIVAPISTDKEANVGDLVALNVASGTITKASEQAWNSDLATTQSDFVLNYLGVCAQKKMLNSGRVFGNSEDNVIRCDSSGVFAFDCTQADYSIGQFVGPAKDTTDALLNQTVEAVADASKAIGVVVEGGVALTTVKVRLLSTLAPLSR